MSISPQTVSLAHIFRWIAGPGSALPSHPLSSSPLGPIRGAGAENKWNAVAKQRLLQNLALNLKISLWSEVELAGWYSLWSHRFCICCQLIEWRLQRNSQCVCVCVCVCVDTRGAHTHTHTHTHTEKVHVQCRQSAETHATFSARIKTETQKHTERTIQTLTHTDTRTHTHTHTHTHTQIPHWPHTIASNPNYSS